MKNLILISAILVIVQLASAYDEKDIQRILKENEEITQLQEYKDDEAMIRMKCDQIDYINSFRKSYKAQPVKFDVLASRVANMHAKMSVDNNYYGHWDINGNTPFLRWGLNGGKDHVTENVFTKWGAMTFKGYTKDQIRKQIEAQYAGKLDKIMREGVDGFMAEGPGGGHHDALVDGHHNFVGIGLATTNVVETGKAEYRILYCEEYLDRYIEFDELNIVVAPNEKTTITGTIIPKDWGLYAIFVYYHPFPDPMTPDEIKSRHSYPDYTDKKHEMLWPWDLTFDQSKQTFSYTFSAKKKGYYYVQLFIKEDISSIPYTSGDANTKGLCNASGLIITVK